MAARCDRISPFPAAVQPEDFLDLPNDHYQAASIAAFCLTRMWRTDTLWRLLKGGQGCLNFRSANMAVPIRCQCGKEYAVPEKRAHKPFKCYVCRRDVIASPKSIPSQPAQQEERIAGAPLSRAGFGAQPLAKDHPQPEPPDGKMQAAYAFAFEKVVAGVSGKKIEDELVKQGLDLEVAQQLVEELEEAHSDVLREAGQKNIIFGAWWFFGGIVVSVISYFLFTNLGSSRFVVATGAILYGGWQFLRGLGQLADAPKQRSPDDA
jgi:hypothetical protein